MRAIVIEQYGVPPTVQEVPEPAVQPGGVVVQVAATGLCRSDWHGWQGHDPDIVLPHVPGHELAGTIAAVGAGVEGWAVGDRVTSPFICACGTCEQCLQGNQQVCPNQLQPGFNYWGSFAEYVALPFAAVNLVRLPESLDFGTAAGLGCRFATSFRAVRQVGRVVAGENVVVFGCGGIGLSAVMIAAALGARVIAVDTNPAALELARSYGAAEVLLSSESVADEIRELTGGGAQVTMDALGSNEIVQSALRSLRPRGRHLQVGLLPSGVQLDVGGLIWQELEWLGSHGMPAHAYPEMLGLVASGNLAPAELITRRISLEEVPAALAALSDGTPAGITVINPWGEPSSNLRAGSDRPLVAGRCGRVADCRSGRPGRRVRGA
ncbi:zinc-dependent alcohol dehydrogenase family protein [Kribbella sp. CA-293567]|uniref:zinc-dependent alcohol dehydrogenase family protein n=1 Tax=Kribbella sp. CA-293567 TaxID=3002436 RepID=UPI0022DDE79D|nr:zinc-dependent alcohol dehydrogenase family protein [Kribbella sp. CA-293567]WBQ04255.1 zinc-dependent alcohol dehydrogenase family protein [Kribbella sp. CA-293567]